MVDRNLIKYLFINYLLKNNLTLACPYPNSYIFLKPVLVT